MLLGLSLMHVVQRATSRVVSMPGAVLFLAGIGAAYGFDRLIDPPGRREDTADIAVAATSESAEGDSSRGVTFRRWTLRCSTAVCFALVAWAVVQMPQRGAITAALLAAASLCYFQLKRVPFVKTVTVAVAWTWACWSLPWRDVGSTALTTAFPIAGHGSLVLALMLFLAAGCVLCDLKDATADAERGIPSLPVLYGGRVTCGVAVALAFLSAGIGWCSGVGSVAAGGVVLGIAALFPGVLGDGEYGAMLVDAVLILPGVLVWAGWLGF